MRVSRSLVEVAVIVVGILGRAMETSASCEARTAPSPHPTNGGLPERQGEIVARGLPWLEGSA
jgi:hypothetical protein